MDFNESSYSKRESLLSLYVCDSRDSGFEDTPGEEVIQENDDFFEEFCEYIIKDDPVGKLPASFSNLIEKPLDCKRKTYSQRRKRDESPTASLSFRTKTVKKCKTEAFTNDVQTKKEDLVELSLQCLYSEPDLVGDFSKKYCLPLTSSRHQDLKAIDWVTMRNLLNGQYDKQKVCFKVIDCRYPYEYKGGHIRGAVNIYTHQQCSSLLEDSIMPDILIFHCEFSEERGPNLSRYLRREDRKKHAASYPHLRFPEIYILKGGYQKFFQENANMCSPEAYVPMKDPNHSLEMNFFRQMALTLDADVKCLSKRNIKRCIKKCVF